MAYKYHIGFLGYGQLTQLAREILTELSWPDTDIQVMNCTADTLQACVEQGRRNGCEVFVGGAANAAEFARQGQGHLVEIPIGDLDYLTALNSALKKGRCPAIVLYRHARLPDTVAYERLLGQPVMLLTYEDTGELEEIISQTKCDIIVGASLAVETAQKLGKAGILLYPGKSSIAQSLGDARRLVRQLHQEQKNQTILRSIVNNSTFGVIVCSSAGEITLFNRAAQQLTGFSGRDVRGRHVDQIFPALKTSRFLAGSQDQQDGYHLIQDTMFRCVQTKIRLHEEPLGVLITFYMDTRSRKRSAPSNCLEWKVQTTFSDWMECCTGLQGCTRQALQYAHSSLSLMILGENGSGREWLSQCIHNSAFGDKQPYVRINFSACSGQEAGRFLLGMDTNDGRLAGVMECANHGTAVLEHLDQAPPQALSCLIDIIRHQRIQLPGRSSYLPINIRFITIATPEERDRMSPTVRSLTGVLSLELPPLREHRQDIPALFLRYLRQYQEQPEKQEKLSGRMEELLIFYDWPGNLDELSTVCQRFLFSLNQETASTKATKYRFLMNAIGEDVLLQALLRQYPALKQQESNTEEFQAGVTIAKEILGYRNSILAEKLGISRTTLWRKLSTKG